MSFTPDTNHHQPDWIKGQDGGEFCSQCGRDRGVPNLLHLPPASPFTKAVSKAFGKDPR